MDNTLIELIIGGGLAAWSTYLTYKHKENAGLIKSFKLQIGILKDEIKRLKCIIRAYDKKKIPN